MTSSCDEFILLNCDVITFWLREKRYIYNRPRMNKLRTFLIGYYKFVHISIVCVMAIKMDTLIKGWVVNSCGLKM